MTSIMITERCNMRCSHCCRSSTESGRDMSMEVFEKSIEFAMEMDEDYGDSHLTITGGEPTLHDRFKEMVTYALGNYIPENREWNPAIIVVTNGTVYDKAMWLARLTDLDRVNGVLSMDDFHSESLVQPDPDVAEAFRCISNMVGKEGIHSVSHTQVTANGRGKGISGAHYGCACEDLLVRPDGEIMTCGCEHGYSIGNAMTEWTMPEGFCPGRCTTEQEEIENAYLP